MAVFGKADDGRIQKAVSDINDRMNDFMRRLRILEQRIQVIDSRINSIEQNLISFNKTLRKELSDRDARISSDENRIEKMEMTINEILKQLKLVATKADVGEVKELIEIYNPLRSKFVTKEEVEAIVDRKLGNI